MNANYDHLAEMSHEMRTPLNAIVGVMEFLTETDLDERQSRWVEVAQNATGRLLALVEGVLDGARNDASSGVEAAAVGVDAVVRASVSLIEPIAILRPVALRFVSEPGERLFVHADEACLGRVLVNLLSNAIKFSPPTGTVSVAVREIDSHVRIEVEDQGSGIAPSCADRVFVPFERLNAEQRGIPGTGLGLSVSRELVHDMGGTLQVVEQADSGAIFRIELPLLSSPTAATVSL